MEKIISLTFHTERLHSDKVWKRVKDVLMFFNKNRIKATWFSVNPDFVGYRAMGFTEEKWIERLNFLKEKGHEIQQHTHFYKGKEGVKKGLGYDLGKGNVSIRILEDKAWLSGKIGVIPEGFVSGAWKESPEINEVLEEQGYKYYLVPEADRVESSDGLVKIPNVSFKRFLAKRLLKKGSFCFITLYCHDYDLERLPFFLFFKALIFFLKVLNFKFVIVGDLYRMIKRNDSN